MKRNINIDRKTLASEEINATKDFSSVVSKAAGGTSVSPKVPKSNSGWIIGGIAAVAIATGIYFGTKNSSPATDNIAETMTEQLDSTETAFVNPPFPEATLPNEFYSVDADKGGEIKHHTGTDITIPAGAFVDEEGNVVTGEVEIQYREFHDQADIFLSGIPMDYDTLDEKRVFESAGMLEIRGFQNGKRLKIAPHKYFSICMHTKNPDPKFNLYHLNEEDKKWDYEGKDSVCNPSPEPMETSLSYDELNNPDLEIELKQLEELTKSEEKIEVIQKEIKTIKQTKPAKPIEADKEKKNFTIDVVENEYPELVVYSGTIFEVKKNEDLPKDAYTTAWNDVKLKEKNNSYLVQLSKGERTEEFAVIPVLEGKDYEEAKAVFDAKFGEYKTKLDTKLKEEKTAEEKLKKLKERFRKEREEYQREMQAMRDRMDTQQASRTIMQRVFNINKFGTWNCDSPVKYPKGMIVKASYVDGNGDFISFSTLNLIEKQRNACFPLSTAMVYRLPFNPKRTNTLWGVTTDGQIAVGKPNEFEGAKDKHVFKMMIIDVKGKSNAEIKKLIAS